VVRTDGDAYARTVVRAEEAARSLELVASALATHPDAADDVAGAIEGPRGPLQKRRSHHGWELFAPGADAARAAAAESAVGLEWSAALVALASFDLSPWSAGS
jgi:hypothetical protein